VRRYSSLQAGVVVAATATVAARMGSSWIVANIALSSLVSLVPSPLKLLISRISSDIRVSKTCAAVRGRVGVRACRSSGVCVNNRTSSSAMDTGSERSRPRGWLGV